jgi:hypothetical protein
LPFDRSVDIIETQFKVIVLEQKLNLNTGEYERKAKELNFTNEKRPVITKGISAQMPNSSMESFPNVISMQF